MTAQEQALEYRDAVYTRLMFDIRGIVKEIANSDDQDKMDRIAVLILDAGHRAELVALDFLNRCARG